MRVGALLLAWLYAFIPHHAQADVLDSGKLGFTVENSALVPVSPDQAWSALVNDIGLWWPADHTWFGDSKNLSIDARAGGCFCELDGPRQAKHLEVAHVAPGKLLRMLGALGPLQGMGLYGVLDWTFDAINSKQTRITLRHRVSGYVTEDLPAFAPIVDRVQAQQLNGLAQYLNGNLEKKP